MEAWKTEQEAANYSVVVKRRTHTTFNISMLFYLFLAEVEKASIEIATNK